MRYSVFFRKEGGVKTCVYNTMSPDLTLALMNPKVHLAADSAGTFECSLNPNSPGMPETVLERMATKVLVEEHKDENSVNNKIIFYGRVLSISEDFYNTPSLYCEGAYSFFNDTVIMPGKNLSKQEANPSLYNTPLMALQALIGEHNAAVTRGGIENGILFSTSASDMIVTMPNDIFSKERQDGSGKAIDDFIVETYTKTLDVLDSLKKTFGGHFRVRYRYPDPNVQAEQNQMAVPILDWIDDMYKEGATTESSIEPKSYIRFGENLLDFTKTRNGANIVNCLFLTGKKINTKGSTVIGDEIDIAPMAYYWKLDKNGNPVDPYARPTTYDTWDSSKYPIHDPGSTSDLLSDGTPKDTDMSHIYHIGDKWYAWNPAEGRYSEITRDFATDTDFEKNDVIRHYGYIYGTNPGSLWPYSYSVSSPGLGTQFGKRIAADPNDEHRSVKYIDESTYLSSGYWNSIDCGFEEIPSERINELDVFPGENYYIYTNGFEGSYLYLITTGTFRTGNATLINSSVASTTGTRNEYTQITIPTISSTSELASYQMHLCISGRDGYLNNTEPSTRVQMSTRLFYSRKPLVDEYITLWGLESGVHKNFLTSEEYTENNQKKTRTVLRRAECCEQNRMGKQPDTSDKWFLYPKAAAGETVRYYANYEELIADTGATGVWYVNMETADVYSWNSESGFQKRIDHRAYVVDSYMVTDDPSTRKYGRIEKIVNYSNCEDSEALKELGAKALFEAKLEALEVNVTALDLSLLETDVDSPDILDPIKIVSEPHKTDIILPLSERDIPLNDPANQQYSIGYQGTQKISKTYSWIRK